MANRKQYPAEFKAKAALATLSNQKTIPQLCAEFGMHQTVIDRWRRELKEKTALNFTVGKNNSENEQEKKQKKLFEKIGQLTVKPDFLLIFNLILPYILS